MDKFFVTVTTDGAHAGLPYSNEYMSRGSFVPTVLRVSLCEHGYADRHFRSANELNGFLSHSG